MIFTIQGYFNKVVSLVKSLLDDFILFFLVSLMIIMFIYDIVCHPIVYVKYVFGKLWYNIKLYVT